LKVAAIITISELHEVETSKPKPDLSGVVIPFIANSFDIVCSRTNPSEATAIRYEDVRVNLRLSEDNLRQLIDACQHAHGKLLKEKPV
jgi:hypothetical protein